MGSSKTTTGVTDHSATETDPDSVSATSANSSRTQTDNEFHTDTANYSSIPLDSPPFAQGEKVLAQHNIRVYEAKVLQIDYKHKEWKFYVHYLGWKKTWDEWLGVDRLMKHTEENLQKKSVLNETNGNDKNAKAALASQIKPKRLVRCKKQKNESIIKETATIHSGKLVNVQIPPTLRKQLVDDCEFVTHLGKLVKLPRTPNVNDIFNKYLDYLLKKDGSVADSVDEIFKRLGSYFDKALPVILLYKNERHQYQEACLNDIAPSTIYGAEHLLRLFVKFPELLLHADIEDEETLMELQAKLNEFLKMNIRMSCNPENHIGAEATSSSLRSNWFLSMKLTWAIPPEKSELILSVNLSCTRRY